MPAYKAPKNEIDFVMIRSTPLNFNHEKRGIRRDHLFQSKCQTTKYI